MIETDRLKFLPQKTFIIYICFTYMLFIFGPIQYKFIGVKEVINSSIYITLFLIAANFAYNRGVAKNEARYKLALKLGNRRIKQLHIVNFSVIYSILLYILLIIQNNNIHGTLSFGNFNYFSLMAETYTYIDYETTFSGWLLSYTAVFRIIGVVGGVYYWDKSRGLFNALTCVLCCLIIVNNTFFVGSQKQTIDLFIYILLALVAKNVKNSKRIEIKTIILVLSLIVAAIIIMGLIINARVELWEDKYNAVASGMPQMSLLKSDNFFYKILPKPILSAMIYLSGYFSQGY